MRVDASCHCLTENNAIRDGGALWSALPVCPRCAPRSWLPMPGVSLVPALREMLLIIASNRSPERSALRTQTTLKRWLSARRWRVWTPDGTAMGRMT